MSTRGLVALVLVGLFVVTGCATKSGLRDTSETITDERWESFDAVSRAFQKIESGADLQEIAQLGFGPRAKNVTLIPYHELLKRLLGTGNQSETDLSEEVRICLSEKTWCSALAITVKRTNTIEMSSFFSKVVLRESHKVTTGWEFIGVIVLLEDRAVYTTSGGQPNIYAINPEQRPLEIFEKVAFTALFALLAF